MIKKFCHERTGKKNKLYEGRIVLPLGAGSIVKRLSDCPIAMYVAAAEYAHYATVVIGQNQSKRAGFVVDLGVNYLLVSH